MTDPTVNRLVAEVEALRTRVLELEQQRRRRHRFLIAALVVGATAAWGQLVTFNADQPAQASQVNGNFTQLRSWIEAKVGPLGAGTGRQNVDIVGTTSLTGPTTVNAGTGNARAMLITGTAAFREPIIDVRHDNQTQGVGLGWGSVVATGSAADVSLTLGAKGNGRVYADNFQINQQYGYELSCGESSYSGGLQGNPFCCRVNEYNGEVICAMASNPNPLTWGNAAFAYSGMGATTPGRYGLSCVAGAPGANYPFCCRINKNTGSAFCGQGSSYALGSSGNVTVF
jgi:hypothetical protein